MAARAQVLSTVGKVAGDAENPWERCAAELESRVRAWDDMRKKEEEGLQRKKLSLSSWEKKLVKALQEVDAATVKLKEGRVELSEVRAKIERVGKETMEKQSAWEIQKELEESRLRLASEKLEMERVGLEAKKDLLGLEQESVAKKAEQIMVDRVQLSAFKSEREELTANLNVLRVKLDELKIVQAEKSTLEEEVEQLQANLKAESASKGDILAMNAKLESEMADIRRGSEESQSTILSLQDEVQRLNEKKSDLEQSSTQLEASLLEAQAENALFVSELAKLKTELSAHQNRAVSSKNESDETVKKVGNENLRLNEMNAALETKVLNLSQALDERMIAVSTTMAENLALSSEIASLRELLVDKEAELSTVKESQRIMEERISTKEVEIAQIVEEKSCFSVSLELAAMENDRLTSELDKARIDLEKALEVVQEQTEQAECVRFDLNASQLTESALQKEIRQLRSSHDLLLVKLNASEEADESRVAEHASLDLRAKNLDDRILVLEEEIRLKDCEIASLGEKLVEAASEVQQYSSEVDGLQKKLSVTKVRVESQEAELQSLNERAVSAEKLARYSVQKIETETIKLARSSAQRSSSSKSLPRISKRQSSETGGGLKEEIEFLQLKCKELENRYAELEKQLSSVPKEKTDIAKDEKLLRLQEENQRLTEQLEDVRRELKDAKEILLEDFSTQCDLMTQISKEKELLRKHQSEESVAIDNNISEMEAELSSLSDMVRELEENRHVYLARKAKLAEMKAELLSVSSGSFESEGSQHGSFHSGSQFIDDTQIAEVEDAFSSLELENKTLREELAEIQSKYTEVLVSNEAVERERTALDILSAALEEDRAALQDIIDSVQTERKTMADRMGELGLISSALNIAKDPTSMRPTRRLRTRSAEQVLTLAERELLALEEVGILLREATSTRFEALRSTINTYLTNRLSAHERMLESRMAEVDATAENREEMLMEEIDMLRVEKVERGALMVDLSTANSKLSFELATIQSALHSNERKSKYSFKLNLPSKKSHRKSSSEDSLPNSPNSLGSTSPVSGIVSPNTSMFSKTISKSNKDDSDSVILSNYVVLDTILLHNENISWGSFFVVLNSKYGIGVFESLEHWRKEQHTNNGKFCPLKGFAIRSGMEECKGSDEHAQLSALLEGTAPPLPYDEVLLGPKELVLKNPNSKKIRKILSQRRAGTNMNKMPLHFRFSSESDQKKWTNAIKSLIEI